MKQLSLDLGVPAKPEKRKLNRTEDGALACAFGEPWMGPHPVCEAEGARIARQFHAGNLPETEGK